MTWCFGIALLPEIVKKLCKCTNLEVRRVATSTGKHRNNVPNEEIFAYFGLVLHAVSKKTVARISF